MKITSGSCTLKKDDGNLVGISIGGGAPLCPCLYIVQVFDNTPASRDGSLAAGMNFDSFDKFSREREKNNKATNVINILFSLKHIELLFFNFLNFLIIIVVITHRKHDL